MATFERHVEVDWRGSVMDGKGEAKAASPFYCALSTGRSDFWVAAPAQHSLASAQVADLLRPTRMA